MIMSRGLVIGFIVLLAVPLAAEAEGTRVNWTFSGAVLQNVAKADVSPTEVSGRATLFQVQAKGSPGSAVLLGINQAFIPGDVIPIDGDPDCFEGADLKFVGGVSENSIVAMFDDLSVLNIVKDTDSTEPSFGCLDLQTSRFYAIVPVKFNGGFGRFENATGTATIQLTSAPVGLIEIDDENPPTVAPSKLLSEVGTITGMLYKN